MDEDPRTFARGEGESNPYYTQGGKESGNRTFEKVKRWFFDLIFVLWYKFFIISFEPQDLLIIKHILEINGRVVLWIITDVRWV